MAKKRRLSKGNRLGMTAIAVIVMVLLVGLLAESHKLSVKNQKYEARKEELEQQIKDEELRAGEIEGLEDYVNSQQYIEQIARDKLGLVYSDETLFVAED